MPITVIYISLCFSSKSVPELFCTLEKELCSCLAGWVVKQWRSHSLTCGESDAVQMTFVIVNFSWNSRKSVSSLFM